MATIYDFSTQQPVSPSAVASFEIVRWGDPETKRLAASGFRVLIDGLVPAELALEMQALCDRHNEKVAQS